MKTNLFRAMLTLVALVALGSVALCQTTQAAPQMPQYPLRPPQRVEPPATPPCSGEGVVMLHSLPPRKYSPGGGSEPLPDCAPREARLMLLPQKDQRPQLRTADFEPKEVRRMMILPLQKKLRANFAQLQQGQPQTTDGYVTTSDGVKIHYIAAGQRSNPQPTILFVPGWTMPAWIWEQQIAHFSKTHKVVAMDPRSQGLSDKPTDGHHPAARARDIKTVIDGLQLAPVVLVGWSMGVTEVVAYVDQFGTPSLAGVVLVDGSAGIDYDPQMSPRMLQFAASFDRNRAQTTAAFVRGMYRKPQTEEYLSRVTRASLMTPTNSAIALFVGTFSTDLRPALVKIDKPALIVVAGDDTNPWMRQYEDMAKRIPGARLEKFADSGHALFVDDAARFNALLDGFLAALPLN